MTICLSYIYKGKEIIGFCDSLGYRDNNVSYDHKKYECTSNRKLLFLFSGDGAPIDDFKRGIRKNSRMFSTNYDIPSNATTALNLFSRYSQLSPEKSRGPWEVLLCGFYEDTPQIAIFNSDGFICKTERKIVITGSSKILQILKEHTFDFEDLEKSQAIGQLGNIIKEAMIEENNFNKESPQTGGPIRRLILSPKGLELLEPIPFPEDGGRW
jgi:20S proteasome alpha/beta subunit